MRKLHTAVIFSALLFISASHMVLHAGQSTVEIRIIGTFEDRIPNVTWVIMHDGDTLQAGFSESGIIQVDVPANLPLSLVLQHPRMATTFHAIGTLESGDTRKFSVKMEREFQLDEFDIVDARERDHGLIHRIDPEAFQRFTAPASHFEGILQTLPGVSAPNEMSAQYQVRGGNYDENLVYINDFEIYRPFLIRSGQQEGLSIINPDMIESIEFSAGGFDASRGDKMSSALSIKYKEPFERENRFSASLLGATAYAGGTGLNENLSYSIGARYRSNQYILGTLDTEGSYQPNFADLQAYTTYYFNDDWRISWLSYAGRNHYRFIPQSRETEFGTVQETFRLMMFFQGQEILEYNNLLNALNLAYEPNPYTTLEFKSSLYTSIESENMDVIGQYWFDELETDLGSEDFGDVRVRLGVGTLQDHVRNRMEAHIYNFEHRGQYERREENLNLEWGLKAQGEVIHDRIHEWEVEDSAGFSIPRSVDGPLELKSFHSNELNTHSMRYSAFAQNTFHLEDSFRTRFTTGIRSQYWNFNNEFTVSPRARMSFEPNRRFNLRKQRQGAHDSLMRNDLILHLSAGVYHQPPFYRELRDASGSLNTEIRSQRSINVVAGGDYFFQLADRPFKWTAEMYYKHLDHLIPFEYDNMRVIYHAHNEASGYAAGIDMKLYGEFIRGLPSWISMSLMDTRETIFSDDSGFGDTPADERRRPLLRETIRPAFLGGSEAPEYQRRRPTNQTFLFSLFFQDFLPMNPGYRVSLNAVYGTGMPHGPPGYPELRNRFTMPGYARVDLGFSAVLSESGNTLFDWDFLGHFKSLVATAEVFNAFGINNTFNYIWIQDLHGSRFAIPNHLTNRRLNIKLEARF